MKTLLALCILASATLLPAQSAPANYTHVTAQQIVDAAGNKLISGTATFAPVDQTKGYAPLSVRIGGGGQMLTRPAQTQVVNGAIAINLADTSLSAPYNFCYQVTVVDNSNRKTPVLFIPCIQPNGSSYSLDNYSTSFSAIQPITSTTYTGNLNLNGNLTVTGNISGNITTTGTMSVGSLYATTGNFGTLRVQQVLGTKDATQFAGADIALQALAAFATCSTSCTVEIPPGNYSFSHTLAIPAPNYPNTGNVLNVDAGAVLTYTGTGDAITTPVYAAAQANTIIRMEGRLLGTASGQNGIKVPFSNHVAIYDANVSGFTSGHGIAVIGGDSVSLYNIQSTGNSIGLFCSPDGSQSSCNNLHVFGGSLAANTQWGFFSTNNGPLTPNLDNSISGVDFEGNGTGGAYLGFDLGTVLENNYFEGNAPFIVVEDSNYSAGINIRGNYFTDASSMTSLVQFKGNVGHVVLEGNSPYHGSAGAPARCFLDEHTDAGGVWANNTYLGPNNYQGQSPVCFNGSAGLPPASDHSFWYGVSGGPNSLTPGSYGLGITSMIATGFVTTANGQYSNAPVAYLGATQVYSGASAPAGGCGNPAIWISPAGLSVCQGGVWTAK